MKRKLFSLLLLLMCAVGQMSATKVFATFGSPANQGSWDGETNTYAWTAGYSNLMPIFTFANGELAEYTTLHLTTNDCVTGPYRVCFMNGGTLVATIAFYSDGEKNLVFSERNETKDIDLSQITSIQFGGASGAGSIGINPASVYLVKPTTLKFGDDGKAHLTAADLDITGSVTVDPQTGVVTSTGNGAISVSLHNCDFSYVTRVDVTRSGEDICNSMSINDAVNGNVNTWYGSRYGLDFTSFQSKAGQVNKLTWNVDKAGTMTISDIAITSDVMKASDARLVDVTSLPYNRWSSAGADATVVDVAYPYNELGKAMGQGSTIFGDGNVYYLNYVDLTGYTSLKIKASAGAEVRICMNRPTDGGTLAVDVTKTVDSEGYATFDLTGYAFSHLHAVKFPYNGKTHTVYSIEATNPNAECSYVISGSGLVLPSVTAVLADATATCIDATGVTGTGVELVSANPNCIFLANDGALSNASNVAVDGVVNNLAITDGQPFALPSAVSSATAASYDRDFSDKAYATVCLPFAAEFTGTAYEFKSESDGVATFATVEGNTLTAGKAYMVKGDFAVTGGSGALALTPADETFKGVYETTVLNSGYGFSGGKFVKIVSNVTCKPFRAYLDLSSSVKSLNVNFGEEDAIVDIAEALNSVEVVYNVNGVRQNGLQKGINVIKMSNGETRKVILK